MSAWRRGGVVVLAAGLAVTGWSGAAASAAGGLEDVRRWRQANEAAIVHELAGLVRLPNLARDAAAIRANAEHLVGLLSRRGLETRLLEVEGSPPAVFGLLRVPGARRTVVFYAHYDGQPVDAARWHGDPWTPVLRDRALEDGGREIPMAGPFPPEARLYGRSASDDKGPIVGLLAALDALRALGRSPTVNVALFLEGEEEAGSPHLESMLETHRERLAADAWLFCDGPVHPSRRMQLYFGVRGVTDLELTLYGPARPLHSGHYGNWAPNPALEMAHLVASLRDEDGRIRVDGFYDAVREPSETERQALREVPDVDAALRHDLALAATEAGGARLVERILLPALNVRGLSSGGVGAAAANAIPTEARASIDFRLVPDQTPAAVRGQVEAHLRRLGYDVVHEEPTREARRTRPRLVRLEWGTGYPAARTSLDLPVSRALARAVGEAAGTPVMRLPTLGGSIGMEVFARVLGRPIIGLPIVNHDNNQHGADENLRLQNLWDGIEVYAAVMTRLDGLWGEE
ncbi:MAG TPA: M20/M25/M40 family metallo-hydrolase [Vicinamibacteria bacterium]|nr:M20/M25/M40 family metallo-hydrolase [Vicinamibacteria bacterium]